MLYSKKLSLIFALSGELAHSLSLAPQEIVDVEGENISLLAVKGPTFDFIGCYKDDGDRAFNNGLVQRYAADTVDYCSERCKNYCYMAIQNGGECFCDSSPEFGGKYGKVAKTECPKETKSDQANYACQVDYGCGNHWRNSVYTNTALWKTAACTDKSPGPLPQTAWKLCGAGGKAAQFSSNLGGKGPDSGPEEFRVEGIATLDGVKLDLVIAVAAGETYRSHTQETKKRMGGAYVSPCSAEKCENDRKEPTGPPCYIVIPFEVKTKTTFSWKFVKSKTSTVYSVRRFGVTVLDLDQERNDWDGNGPDRQYVEFQTQASSLTVGTGLKEKTIRNGVKRVESVETGNFGENPAFTGPPLTDKQKARSVEATYTERGQWDLTIGHTGGNSRFDRHVVLSGWISGAV